MRAATVLLAVALPACGSAGGGQGRASGGDAGQGYEPVTVRRVGSWQQSGLEKPLRRAIRSRAGLDSLPQELAPEVRRRLGEAARSPDGGTLVLAALGERRTDGYGLRLTADRDAGGGLRVTVHELRPGRGCVVTQALTTPAAAIRLPVSSDPVTFREESSERPC